MAGREYPSSFLVSIDCGDIISPYDASGCNDTDLFRNMTGSRVARDRRSSPTGVETLVFYLSLMPAYLSDNLIMRVLRIVSQDILPMAC